MPSEKVTRILLSKTDMPAHQISSMTEDECWDVVYSLPKSPQRRTICFTGFRKSEKADLAERAEAMGLKVSVTVGDRLDYLMVGPNAGPAKVAKAKRLMIPIIDDLDLAAAASVELDAPRRPLVTWRVAIWLWVGVGGLWLLL